MSNKTKTRKWELWAAQVNVNYHNGGMTLEDAEIAAGTEPEKYELAIEDFPHAHKAHTTWLANQQRDYDDTVAGFLVDTGRV